ncbi:hypothetical protein L3X38_018280 [Prunus dulcis]|uniref:Uncharacterized protein n=1 Tax=Prunus dulcis TaxID=3755 RepID=A0AAD4ZBH5_PRUDU|nr:hypothetical protein L3X38_018280 [Prunus dulcis]
MLRLVSYILQNTLLPSEGRKSVFEAPDSHVSRRMCLMLRAPPPQRARTRAGARAGARARQATRRQQHGSAHGLAWTRGTHLLPRLDLERWSCSLVLKPPPAWASLLRWRCS